jgi:aminoglycoside phosphotransferase family enzyme
MPNWVFNGLTAQGPKESIYKMKAQLNTPFVDYIEATARRWNLRAPRTLQS